MLTRLRLRLHDHRRAVIGALVVFFIAMWIVLFLPQIRGYFQKVLLMRDSHSTAFHLLFFGLFVGACLTSVFPASILGVLAGSVFGQATGFALSAGAMMTSALLAFLFSRYFFRKLSRRIVARVIDLDALEEKLVRDGWRYALLLRLAPLAPFSITSYGLGLTPLSLGQYLLTSLAGLPFLLVCVFLGSFGGIAINASGGVDGEMLRQLVVTFTAVVVLVSVLFYFLQPLARRLLNSGNDDK